MSAIEHIDIDTLRFDDTNPNKLSTEQYEGLKTALKKYGYLSPIIVNTNHEIADGEHRAKAYKELGFKTIPAYVVSALDNDNERKLLRQIMNKLRGKHDLELDINELTGLMDTNYMELNDILQISDKTINEMQTLLDAMNKDSTSIRDTQGEGITEFGNLKTEHTCPKCGYEW